MKNIILAIFVAVVLLSIIIPLENQLSGCQFECNHLQTKKVRSEEANRLNKEINNELSDKM